MNLDRQLMRRKAAYVQAIGDSLHHLNGVDREAVLEDVEDHIDAALYDGPGPADMERLEEILQDLGDPESYAADVAARLDPVDPKLCALAPLGMVWSATAIFIGLPLMFMVRVVEQGAEPPEKTITELILLVLGWIGLIGFIGGPTVSAMAVSKIRGAQGRLVGMYPALIGLYMIPFAFLDLLLMYISFEIFTNMVGLSDDLGNILILCLLVVLVYWNAQVIRKQHSKLSPTRQ